MFYNTSFKILVIYFHYLVYLNTYQLISIPFEL